MVRLHRNKRTGDYYTEDNRFTVERGSIGWNIYDNLLNTHDFGGETLKEVRGSIEYIYAHTEQLQDICF